MEQYRCAIYTRTAKSDDYSSLEFQKNCCEGFIEVREAQGWIVSKVYEDYGKSGANLERPGLQELLADIRAGKIDCVVVYKFDRLTRSIRDFETLNNDVFLKYGISFVSLQEAFESSIIRDDVAEKQPYCAIYINEMPDSIAPNFTKDCEEPEINFNSAN
ncbi:MAG: recombinase family protein [Holosporales bacterium]|jgi:site-specific DNA recombinase|nr:recombinase family protein [Holosporales bacterium]